jgi:hypothetical protein
MIALCFILLFLGTVQAGENTPAAFPGQIYHVDKSEDKTPAGAAWPICWKFDFSIPKKIIVNKPFTAEVKITPLLFGLDKIEMVPVSGEGIKLVKADPWKGRLKSGETKVVKVTMVASKAGDSGNFGVMITSSDFYKNFKKYIINAYEGPAKDDLLERLAAYKRSMPVYQEYAGSGIKATSK